VSFTATQRQVESGQTRVTELLDFAVVDLAPVDVGTIRQDISALDFLAAIDDLESESIHLDAAIAVVGAAGSSGAGHTAIQVTTATLPTASASVVVRLPDTVVAALSPAPGVGCTIALDGNMWRFSNASGTDVVLIATLTGTVVDNMDLGNFVFFTP
jgi:hypothetical protein